MTTYEEDDEFIKVIEKEDSDFMEFPKEEDGTVLLRTIQTQFDNAIGLKYKGPSGAWRAVREVEDALVAPKGGWGGQVYSLTFSETKKRKTDSEGGESDTKYTKTSVNSLLKPMAVLGLPFTIKDAELREYLELKYGELEQCQVKFDRGSGKSKGFGFVCFKYEEHARAALNGEDYMDGRRIFVKEKKEKPMKMYVNGLPEGTTQEDLIEYFNQFGTVVDSYLSKPFRSFAFFTFSSSDDGSNCLKQQHTFRGAQLKVKIREEKQPTGDGSPGFRNDAARGGYGTSTDRGGFRGRVGFRGGYHQQGYPGPRPAMYMPPQMPRGPGPGPAMYMPPQMPRGQNDTADLKNKLLQLLTS